jgi:NAD(P)-dependent dehydrogenase (short-subunit alcohol dehydrogenase family)
MSKPVEKVTLVTGGGSGIGQAVALGMQAAGYRVAICGRRQAELQRTAGMVPSGAPIVCIPADVSQPDSVKAMFTRIKETFGRIDVLFNNAGRSAPPIPMEDLTFEQWNSVVGANLTGVFLCAQEAIRMMKAQDPKGGRIINNGSISAYTPRPFSAPYAATKHGVLGLTKCISLDGRADNIACSQIDIGNAATPMTERMAEGILQPSGAVIPEDRLDLKHVVDAVLYVAGLPLEANAQYLTVMATKMPYVGRG